MKSVISFPRHEANAVGHTKASFRGFRHSRDINTPELTDLIVNDIRDALTGNFDVIPEKTHLHTEWDPK